MNQKLLFLTTMMMIFGCNQEENMSRALSSAAEFDAESYATIQLVGDVEGGIEPEILSEMEEADIPDEISIRKEKILEDFDVNGNGQIDKDERIAVRQHFLDERLEKYDANGDGKLDASEKSQIRAQISVGMKGIKKQHKGRHSKSKICAKAQIQADKFNNEGAGEKPMFQKILAKCENVEINGDMSYGMRKGKRCEKVKDKEQDEKSRSPGFIRLLEKCSANNSDDDQFDSESFATLSLLEDLEGEDSDVASEMDEGDISGSISFRKEKFLEKYDANDNGKIDEDERQFISEVHMKKRLDKFDLNGDDQLDDSEKKAMHEKIKGQFKMHRKKKGPNNFTKICQKLSQRADVLNSENAEERPMVQKIIAKCEGIEIGKIDTNPANRKVEMCEKVRKKIDEGGGNTDSNPRLARMLAKCPS